MSDKWRLQPCPFCGEALQLKMQEFPEDNYIQCQTCTTTGPNGFDQECAVLQWNKREGAEQKLTRLEADLETAVEALGFVDKCVPKGNVSIMPQRTLQFCQDKARAALEKIKRGGE